MLVDLSSQDTRHTFAFTNRLDKNTTIKARVDSNAVLAGCFQHQLTDDIRMAISAEVRERITFRSTSTLFAETFMLCRLTHSPGLSIATSLVFLYVLDSDSAHRLLLSINA